MGILYYFCWPKKRNAPMNLVDLGFALAFSVPCLEALIYLRVKFLRLPEFESVWGGQVAGAPSQLVSVLKYLLNIKRWLHVNDKKLQIYLWMHYLCFPLGVLFILFGGNI